MIDRRLRPVRCVMALSAVSTHRTVVRIVALVARIAIRRRSFIHAVYMTSSTGDIDMLAGERVGSLRRMIDGRLGPVCSVVALNAVRAKRTVVGILALVT